MKQASLRRNPLTALLKDQSSEWCEVAGMPIVSRYASSEHEQQLVSSLAICDVSALPKVGVKGPEASAMLESLGLRISETYSASRIAEEGYCLRLGRNEYFLEGSAGAAANDVLASLLEKNDGHLLCTERQDAGFELSGDRVHELFKQVCGIDLSLVETEHVVMTRVAGVSCCILNRVCTGYPAFRIWLDPSYACYLWDTLLGITRELGGDRVGAGIIFPDLA